MALVIPKDVGGTVDVQGLPSEPVAPIEARSAALVIPSDVGGTFEPQQAVPQVQAAPKTGFADIFTGSERIEATPELGTLPEFGTTEEGNTFKIAAGLLSTANPKAQMEMIQSAIPEAVFETTPDGSIFIEVPTEEGGIRRSVLNRPGFSPQDLTTGIAQVLTFLPAAKMASLGKTVLQKMGLGAIAAGATEQATQEAGIATLGRETRDPTATGIAAVTGGLAEGVVPAVQAVRGARQASQIGAAKGEIQQTAQSVKAAQEATEATGVPLFKAQQTGIPAQLEKQSFVAQLPAGTRSAVAGLKEQNQAAGDAVETFLGQIAPDSSVVTGAEKLRTAAQNAVQNVKNIRAEKASPIYKQAFKDGADVDVKPLNDFIETQLSNLPETGEIAKSLNKVTALTKGKSEASPSLELLHNAKLEIDQMLKGFGENSLGNTTKAKLTQAKDILLQQMDDASEGYAAARKAFADASPEVTKIQDSIIGKIAKLDDTQLKQVSSKIFDPSQTNPAVIANAKKSIQDVDPEAWSQIVRVELEKRLGSIKSTQEAGTVENLPGQLFRALFPNDKSTKVLMNALDAEGKKNLKFLQTALGRARLGRPGGSQTASREEIKKELRGGIFQALRNFIQRPISSAATVGEDAAFNSRAAAMAKALYDPTWKAEMKHLRTLNPNSPAAARAMTQLLNDISNTEDVKN